MSSQSHDSLSTDGSDLRKYLQAIRRHVILIVTLAVLAVGAALIVSETSTKRYDATADLLVSPVASNDETFLGINVFRDSTDQSRSVLTLSRLLASEQIGQRVKVLLHSPLSARALLSRVTIQPVGQASIVSITASSPDPRAAAAIANAFATAIIQQRSADFQHDVTTQVDRVKAYLKTVPAATQNSNQAITLQQRLAQLVPLLGAPDPTLRLANPASAPTSPVWPRPTLAAAIALLAALLIGSALAIAIEFWNPNVRDENEILLSHRLPILARVPRLKGSVANAYLAGKEPLPPSSWEAYRRLRAALDQPAEGVARGPLSVVVTSAAPGEGKTMTSLSLALSFATAGKRVVLVDADLRRPMLASIFRVPPASRGIETALAGGKLAPLLVQPPEHPNLSLLLTRPENAAIIDSITPERVASLIEALSRHAEVIIFDTAPVGEAAETLAFAETASAVLLAIRLGSTRRDRLADTLRLFAQQRVRLAGVVVTTDRAAQRSSYYYAYSGPAQPKISSSPQSRLSVASADDPADNSWKWTDRSA
jgi:Mrp family chromosome partitioning ATPase/capsular polysaccharide biosynthesis protein